MNQNTPFLNKKLKDFPQKAHSPLSRSLPRGGKTPFSPYHTPQVLPLQTGLGYATDQI